MNMLEYTDQFLHQMTVSCWLDGRWHQRSFAQCHPESPLTVNSSRTAQPISMPARKQTALDRGRTDRISLTHDLDLPSPVSYGHDLLM